MNKPPEDNYVLPGWMRPWETFWFTPADPSVLALIRMACGAILVYTLIVYSFQFQDLMGPHAWSDLEYRMYAVRERPLEAGALTEIAPVTDEGSRTSASKTVALYDKGMDIFSLWFHVTDPTAMAVLHGLFVTTAIFFTIGFCTRITAPLAWFAFLTYAHRNPNVLFGADQVTTLILSYLMISPCGAAYSVDRLVQRWRNGPLPLENPQPSILANFAIRLLQIQVCIIYLIAGLAKLLGPMWWSGIAVWFTISCYEFAPMRNEMYMDFLRFLARNQIAFAIVVTCGGYFTIAFEISYIFLVWRPRLRWVFIGSAIFLHGLIGFFMGLTTFSWLMLVMNMAFLRKEEVHWLFSWFRWGQPAESTK